MLKSNNEVDEFEKEDFKSENYININVPDRNNIIAGHLKKYNCEICGKSFTKGDSLKTHINIVHEGQPRIPCDHCETTFTRKADMRRHVLNIHEGSKPYKCHLCPKECFLFKNLRGHYQRVHEKNITKNDLKHLKPFQGEGLNVLDDDETKVPKVLYHSTETKFLGKRGVYLRGSGSKKFENNFAQDQAQLAQGPVNTSIDIGDNYNDEDIDMPDPDTEMTGIKIGGQFTQIMKNTVDIKDVINLPNPVINNAENEFKQIFGGGEQDQTLVTTKNEIPKVKKLIMYPRNTVDEKAFEKFDEDMKQNKPALPRIALGPAHSSQGHSPNAPGYHTNIAQEPVLKVAGTDGDLEIIGQSITKRYKTKYKYLCNQNQCNFSSYDSKEMLHHAQIHSQQPKGSMPTLLLGLPIQPKGIPTSNFSKQMSNNADKIHDVKKITSVITPQQILATNSNIKIVTKTGIAPPTKKFENKVVPIKPAAHIAQGLPVHVAHGLPAQQKRQWPINDIKSIVTKTPPKTNIKIIDMTKNAEKNQGNNGGKIYPCGNCNQGFLTIHELTKHVAGHEKPAEVIDLLLDNDKIQAEDKMILTPAHVTICSLCGKEFRQKEEFINHMKIKHALEPAQHVVLGSTLSAQGHAAHVALGPPNQSLKDNIAGSKFCKKEEFVDNIKVEPYAPQGPPPARGSKFFLEDSATALHITICSMCGGEFRKKEEFIDHMKVEHGKLPLVCSLCNFQCFDKATKAVHNCINKC